MTTDQQQILQQKKKNKIFFYDKISHGLSRSQNERNLLVFLIHTDIIYRIRKSTKFNQFHSISLTSLI